MSSAHYGFEYLKIISELRKSEVHQAIEHLTEGKSVLVHGAVGVDTSEIVALVARELCNSNKPLGQVVWMRTVPGSRKDFLKEIVLQLDPDEYKDGKPVIVQGITCQALFDRIVQKTYSSEQAIFLVISYLPTAKVIPQIISDLSALIERGIRLIIATDSLEYQKPLLQKFHFKIYVPPFDEDQAGRFAEHLLNKGGKAPEDLAMFKKELYERTGGISGNVSKAIDELPSKITSEDIKSIKKTAESTIRYLYLWFAIPLIIALTANRYLIYYSSWSRAGKVLSALGFILAIIFRLLIYGWIKKGPIKGGKP